MSIFLLINIAFAIYFFHCMFSRKRDLKPLLKVIVNAELSTVTSEQDYLISKIESEINVLMLDYTGFLINVFVILWAIFK